MYYNSHTILYYMYMYIYTTLVRNSLYEEATEEPHSLIVNLIDKSCFTECAILFDWFSLLIHCKQYISDHPYRKGLNATIQSYNVSLNVITSC